MFQFLFQEIIQIISLKCFRTRERPDPSREGPSRQRPDDRQTDGAAGAVQEAVGPLHRGFAKGFSSIDLVRQT